MIPQIISFYTKNTPYEKEAKALSESCKKFQLDSDIVGIDTLGDWEVNCCYKSKFLLNQLETKKKPLIWIDADGEINKRPTLFETIDADLAVWINKKASIHHLSKVISSTIYINYTENTLKLLRLWKNLCEKQLTDPKRKVEIWDQTCLRDAMFHQETQAKILPLPDSYCARFDDPIKESPVITQYQASRLYKPCINGETVSLWNQMTTEELREFRSK
ncbi:MAG: hypothetical protein KAR79_03020 [Simkaniaceae bacterium]|nr:hypothetical protein [Simkaniaceae bacterium]